MLTTSKSETSKTAILIVVVCRFGSLSEPCNIRRENLEDSLLLYTFYRDVDDEMLWISEKRPIAAMTDLGTNLQTVQSLQKKHQVTTVLFWLIGDVINRL